MFGSVSTQLCGCRFEPQNSANVGANNYGSDCVFKLQVADKCGIKSGVFSAGILAFICSDHMTPTEEHRRRKHLPLKLRLFRKASDVTRIKRFMNHSWKKSTRAAIITS